MIIYILKCENGKFYVGKTNDMKRRYEEHLRGEGSGFTAKYKPLEIVKLIENADEFDEDKYVKMYMSQYGINNVRGGVYLNEELTENEKQQIEREIIGAKDLCFICGKSGHFANNCPEKKNEKCYRCGRPGHYMKDCYAKTDIYGNHLDSNSTIFFDTIETIEKFVVDIWDSIWK